MYTLEGESGEHSIRDKGFLSDCSCLLAFKQLNIVWLHAWHLLPWFASVFPCGHLCSNPPLSESFVASGLQPEGRANFRQIVAPHSLQATYLTGVNTEGIRPWELPGVGGWGKDNSTPFSIAFHSLGRISEACLVYLCLPRPYHRLPAHIRHSENVY